MQEYIIYAIFIFFPIGVLMNFLLRRQGLISKYRLVIIAASLAIIISFPILMANLGLPIALLLYVSAILALTWFFIKATQSHAWYLRQAGSANDEVYVSDRFIDMTKVQTVGDIEDAIWPKEPESTGIDASIDISNSVADNNDNSVITEIIIDHDSINDQPSENELLSTESIAIQERPSDLQQNIKTEYIDDATDPASDEAESPLVLSDQNEEIINEEHIIMEASFIDAKSELPGLIDSDMEMKNVEAAGDILPVLSTENVEASAEPGTIEIEKNNNADAPVPDQEIAAVLEPEMIMENISTESNPELKMGINSEDNRLPMMIESMGAASLNEAVDTNAEPEVEIDQLIEIYTDQINKEAPDNTEDININREDDRINQLIDQAFELKNGQRTLEALKCFAEALDICIDEDLRYLLLMEMVSIYKDMGMYAQAEELLFLSIGKAYRRTDIIDEIERQLSYIRLLSVELDRLGLANTPISEVPRLVRMNVAEIVKV